MNALLTIFLQIAQAVSVALVIGALKGRRFKARVNKHRSMNFPDPVLDELTARFLVAG